MKRKIKNIVLISAVTVILFIFPYSKIVEVNDSEDVKWSYLNLKFHEEFDIEQMAFKKKYEINEKVKNLNNKKIKIKGFLNIHKQYGEKIYFLTSSVTDACFFCNHDSQITAIKVLPENNNEFKNVGKDYYIEIEGVFILNKNQSQIYKLQNAKLISLITKNK